MARRPSLPTPAPLRHRAERHAHRGLLTHRSVADALISLAGIVGQPVRNQAGDEVGRVADVVARWDGGPYPPATGLVVKVGRRPAFLPIAQVATMKADEVRLRSARLDLRDFQRRPGEVVLGRDVLDRQLVDVDGVRVVRASDLYLARVGLAWRLVGVDVSFQSLLRRLGPARRRHRATPDRVLDWSAVQPFGSQPGELRLSRSSQALKRLRPSEVADLLEELGRDERQALLDALDPGVAADALEEMQPEELEQLLREAPVARAAALVAAMEPDEAADALRDLGPEERAELLDAMPDETAGDLAALLTFSEESAGGLMTTHLVTVPIGTSVQAVRDRLREETDHRADVDRVLVIDDDGTLVDDLALFDLFLADPDASVDDLVEPPWPVTVHADASLEEVVARLVDSRAASVVVVDDADRPIGRILADDVVDALVPEKAKLRFPRILA
ncbi:MAG TPA: CBS domain-containing protein [Acidimicrobiales bacterium]